MSGRSAMTIAHHPSDTTLAAFAAGQLDAGRSLVVSVHLDGCAGCRRAVRAFEGLGGVALEDAEASPLSAGALDRALSAIASDRPQPNGAERERSEWPAPLSSYPLGPWRQLGGSVQLREVQVPSDRGTRIFLLKAAPGTRIPVHAHAGFEWTCVLQGAFRHQLGHYGSGDFDEADDEIEHRVIVEEGMDCVCLVALQGQIKFKSFLGRVIQPFVRL
jgi:putative transcriptional regulator